jgi:glycosyltransferase involved in cell wall biosynthesis
MASISQRDEFPLDDKRPTVSVIIPTFRRADLVSRAISSVLRQTFEDLELIVVDDASPDNTREVVQAISDPRVRYVRHERNRGLPAVRNTGVRNAAGEFIAFLDDDDEWRDDKLEKQLQAIKLHDVVVCAYQVNGRTVTHYRKSTISSMDLRQGNQFPPSGWLAKTSVLKEVLFDETVRQGEDWDTLIRIAARYRIGYLSDPLLVYNDGGHERMSNEGKNKSIQELDQRMHMLYKHREYFGPYWFRRHVADTYLRYIGSRKGRSGIIMHAVKVCGPVVVIAVLYGKIVRQIRLRFF